MMRRDILHWFLVGVLLALIAWIDWLICSGDAPIEVRSGAMSMTIVLVAILLSHFVRGGGWSWRGNVQPIFREVRCQQAARVIDQRRLRETRQRPLQRVPLH